MSATAGTGSNPLRGALPRWAAAFLLLLVLPLLGAELWARTALFRHASYTNSRSLDASWRALHARDDWTVVFLGDSEVRWGFDPDAFDAALRQEGLESRGFNLGIDGFSSTLGQGVVSFLDIKRRMPALRVAVIGTQLIEAHRNDPVARFGDIGCDGALQRPVFASPMARDLGLDLLCRRLSWSDRLVRTLEDHSALLRYRKALRGMLVGTSTRPGGVIAFNSTALAHRPNGFQPNRPITEARRNHEQALRAREADIARYPHMSGPLDPAIWERLTAPGGYFDRWAAMMLADGVLPVFVALPTNPLLIDMQKRREEYHRNAALLAAWARRRGDVVFVDPGIQDGLEPERDYSDLRHLSIHGAATFSARLGRMLAEEPLVRRALAPGG